MEKSKVELLLDYKKSNKERRKRIVERSGLLTELAYVNYLLNERISTSETILNKKITANDLVKKAVKKTVETGTLDVVIAFDTTTSMSDYITAVRKQVEELITKWFRNVPNLKIKIVAFGDYYDMQSPTTFGNAYQETPLTDDANTLIDFVRNSYNNSGGDNDEFYELVIKKIVEETPWRGGKRSVLLIGDCDPHQVGYTHPGIVNNAQIDWRVEAKKAASLNIPFDTVTVGHYSSTWYKKLSEITGGVSLPFTSKSKNKTGEMIGATIYARGASNAVYKIMSESTSTVEMSAVYKTLSTLR